jgi:hypothetical protein
MPEMEKEIKFGGGVRKIGLEKVIDHHPSRSMFGRYFGVRNNVKVKMSKQARNSNRGFPQRYVASSDAFRGEKWVNSKPLHHTPKITC